MAENKIIEDAKKIEDKDLDKVSGGYTPEELEPVMDDLDALLKGAGNVFHSLSEALQMINEAAETNTCPICKEKIIPLADKCKPEDFLNHFMVVHDNKL